MKGRGGDIRREKDGGNKERERESRKWVTVGRGGDIRREKDGGNKERVSNLVFYAQSRRERE